MRLTDSMNRAHPLPTELQNRPFAVAEATRLGVSASRLRATDLVAPTRGVRAVRAAVPPLPEHETASERMERLRKDLLRRIEEVAPALTRRQFVSHESGLALLDTPLPYTEADKRLLHVSTRRPAAKPRRDGVVGHRLQQRTPSRWTVRGIPIENPARLWRQIGGLWKLDEVIASGDFLVLPRRRLATIEELRQEVEIAGDVTSGVLTRALEEIRVGSETAEETHLRLLLTRHGLPWPELNIDLRAPDGRFVARLDIAYPRYHVAVEHDGRTHAFDEKQFARDADRWDDIRSQGWRHVCILSHHLRPDERVAVAKVTEALIENGWRPGQR